MLKNHWRWLYKGTFQLTAQHKSRVNRGVGVESPRSRCRHRALRVEFLEDRFCLATSAGGAWDGVAEMIAATTASLPVISEQQAVALAINNLNATPEGFVLANPRHTATFTPAGVLMEPTDGGPTWHWQLSYVGTDAAALADVQVGLVTPGGSGANLITYDRGGLIEQYVARADSVEQQFVIPAPLALDGGDLIVAGTIQSDGEFTATGAGWEWRTDDGVISLGDVTVLDAAGTEIAATMQVTASETRIVIEAAALQEAVYPLLIDPEVGTNDFRISDMGPGAGDFDAFQPAVAYNSTNNEFLVVWSGDNDTNDEFEIFGQRINAATGAEVGTNDFRISDMGADGDINTDAVTPAVAYNSTNNEYLVVWSGDDLNDDFEIFSQRLNAATGAEVGTNDFGISTMGTVAFANPDFDAVVPAVAYNSINNEYLVVWQGDDNIAPLVDNEIEIFGQRLSAATGAAVGADDFRISDMGPNGNVNFGAFAPAVAYNRTSNEYLVVWNGDDNTAPLVDNEREIFGQRLNAVNGAEVGTNDFRISDMGPDGNTSFRALSAAVVHNSINNQYLVVWIGDDNIAPLVDNEFEVFGQRLSAAGAAVGTNDFRISDMGPDGNTNFEPIDVAVAYNSILNEFLVVWVGDDNTAPLVDGEFETFGQRLSAATGTAIGTNDFRISDMGPNGDIDFVADQLAVAFNSTNNQYLVPWHGDDTTNNEFEIFGQRLTAAGAETGTNDFRISDMGAERDFIARQAAVAYNSTNNQYLVVWSGEDTTSNEFEIFGQRINAATGGEVGANDFRISDMGPDGNVVFDAFNPAVAYNSVNNEFLVVWEGDDDTAPLVDNEFEIFGQRLNAATGAAVGTNDFRISDIGPDGDVFSAAADAAVAYNSTNNEYLVVWEGDDGIEPINGELEIFGQRLNAATGAAVGTNDFRISDMGPDGNNNFRGEDPAVAYNSIDNQYLVVWSGEDTTDDEFEIFGQQLNAIGAAVGENDFRISDMGPDGNVNFDASLPSVAFNSVLNEYLVVWQGDDTTDQEFEIFGQRLGSGVNVVLDGDFRISDMGPDGNVNFGVSDPSVAYNSFLNKYLVVWSGDDNTAPLVDNQIEIFGQQLNGVGVEEGTNDFLLSDMGPNGQLDFFNTIRPAVTSNSTVGQFLVVWDGLDNGGVLGDGEQEIFGQRFEIGDFGDAPDSYTTRLANNGAWHRLGTPLFLGVGVDAEEDGLPTANAMGDDTTDIDDEDGVTLETLTPANQSTVRVVASLPGKLDAFIDFNGDGDFADAGEKIFNSFPVVAGANDLSFLVAAGAVAGNTFARFRLSSAGGHSFNGRADDGEVEDYAVRIAKACVGTEGRDVLRLRPAPGQPGAVVCNRVAAGIETTLQMFGPTDAIVVMALGGDDTVSVLDPVTRSALLNGGAGNDRLEGGSGDDILLGGDGNDWLVGGAGRNLLIGGRGRDLLFGYLPLLGIGNPGARDESILIGDRTTFDNHAQALLTIMQEWSSGNSFAQRVTNLRTGVMGVKLANSTILDDNTVDALLGSLGRDWFWRRSLDLLANLQPQDQLN